MAVPAPELAQIEGKYEILEKLREGGMGALYKVRHRLLEEVRVIKVIRPQLEAEEGLRERFLGEARSASRLRHPNIASLFDFSMDEEGVAFMVMEYIDGEDLGRKLRREGRLPVGLTLEVAIQSLRALEYLHRNQFVHRDISPDNLMVTRDVDGRTLVKLIDLGIAKELRSEANLTKSGYFLGKIKYASPEQFGAQGGVIDHRSDLYSLGVVLYEILTGGHPFGEGSQQTLLAGHLFKPPRDFAETDPAARIPGNLRAVVLRALEKDPDDRFPDTGAMSLALQQIQTTWQEPEAEPGAAGATLLRPELGQVVFEPGSTQERLDRQFEPVPTRPPIAPVPAPVTSTAAPVAEGTRRLEPAPRAAPEPTRLERPAPPEPTRLEAVPTAAPAVAVPVRRAPEARRVRPGWLWPAAGGAALLVVGAVGWLVLSGPSAETPPPPEAAPIDTGAEAPGAAAPVTVPAAPAGDPVLEGFLGAARGALADGDGPGALASTLSALELDPANAEARRLLEDLVGVTRREAEAARRGAMAAAAPERAGAVWSRAEGRVRDAEASARAGLGADAVRGFRDGASLFAEAARVARQAGPATSRPEAVPTRPAPAAPEPAAPEPAAPAPGTSTAEAPAQMAPAPTPTAGDREQQVAGIVATLRAFAEAHQRLDLTGLQRIWPSLSGQRLQALRESFDGAREIEMYIGDCEVRVEGATATANCTLRQSYRPKRGTRQTIERAARFELAQRGGTWIIEDY
jgi:serine/threonine-protein kinase